LGVERSVPGEQHEAGLLLPTRFRVCEKVSYRERRLLPEAELVEDVFNVNEGDAEVL